jgi:hypothetical protein
LSLLWFLGGWIKGLMAEPFKGFTAEPEAIILGLGPAQFLVLVQANIGNVIVDEDGVVPHVLRDVLGRDIASKAKPLEYPLGGRQ